MSSYLNGTISKNSNQNHINRLRKPIIYEIFFDNNGDDFSALHLAEDWLKRHGIDYGSLERGNPVGLARDGNISKWSGLTNYGAMDDASKLDGIMVCEETFRDGRVAVYLTYIPTEKTKGQL